MIESRWDCSHIVLKEKITRFGFEFNEVHSKVILL